MRTILLATVIFGLQTSTMAQSGAIESVRNWYEAYSKLDSTGLFELWALDHKDFIYAHDVEVLKSEQFIDFLNNVIKNTEQIIKADMMEGHLHDISNDAACYTTKALVKGIVSGNTISFVVTATNMRYTKSVLSRFLHGKNAFHGT